MAKAFVSYSHKDSEYAHKISDELTSWGITPWIDDRIDYGTQWPIVIEQNLDECDAFILVMSKSSKKSKWVQNELAYAQEKKKRIFPLLLEGEIWLSVAAIQYVDVREGILPPKSFFYTLSNLVPGNLDPMMENRINSKARQKNIRSISNKLNVSGELGKALSVNLSSSESKIILQYIQNKSLLKIGNEYLLDHLSGNMKSKTPNQKQIDSREEVKDIIRSKEQDDLIKCPVCTSEVKSKNLLGHIDSHDQFSQPSWLDIGTKIPLNRENIKNLAADLKPDTYINCPVFLTRIKAKNLLIHFDRGHSEINKIILK